VTPVEAKYEIVDQREVFLLGIAFEGQMRTGSGKEAEEPFSAEAIK
jgi:hypothetical protein